MYSCDFFVISNPKSRLNRRLLCLRSSIVQLEEQRRVYRIDAGSNPAAGPIVACLLRLINHRLVQSVALASPTLADCSGEQLSH